VTRLAYLGTPAAAVAPLEALAAAGHDVTVVVTRPEARRGRGGRRTPSPVGEAAARLGITVADRLEEVAGSGAELGVVVAYGRIVPAWLLEVLPMVNLHFSLLPRWRGAAPVERAILAGDSVTGVCLMRLEAGLDTGPVLDCRRVPMDDDHAGVLTARLARLGADMLVDALRHGAAGLGPGVPQRGDPTYAAKIEPDELRLDWHRPAAELHRVVRLDRAWTTFRGRRLRVLDSRVGPPTPGAPGSLHGTTVATGAGGLQLVTVQPEGRRPMGADDWRRGVRAADGERLGADGAGAVGGGPEDGR
jgi:methionyl-tRNA formyltransferase